ncbi:50S ribosomal protein L18 [Candidatus Hepatincolaceae symbiont of Richtersius coronifer]
MLRKIKDKEQSIFLRRRNRIRYKLKKTQNKKPRLSVYISNLHIYAQVINDLTNQTVASASTLDKELKGVLEKTSNKDAASAVGKLVAERLAKTGINEVVFDRGGKLFHGKIKNLADSAREHGLKF